MRWVSKFRLLLAAGPIVSSASATDLPRFSCSLERIDRPLEITEDAVCTRLRSLDFSEVDFTFDAETGNAIWKKRSVDAVLQMVLPVSPQRMEVWQRGTEANDWIALRKVEGPASNPLDVLRIRSWSSTPRFVWLGQDGVVFSGNCRLGAAPRKEAE
jgi:hypothetical protein